LGLTEVPGDGDFSDSGNSGRWRVGDFLGTCQQCGDDYSGEDNPYARAHGAPPAIRSFEPFGSFGSFDSFLVRTNVRKDLAMP
jgi:hypothetical protein